jgi:hypothetical protein
MNSIVPISFTGFLDFIASTGTKRVSVVKRLKYRPDYAPALDFYKPLREAILAGTVGGSTTALEDLLRTVTDAKKAKVYPGHVHGFKTWQRSKHDIRWFAPVPTQWTYGDFGVRVNSELGFELGGVRTAVKLYFKKPGLSKRGVDAGLYLMREALPSDIDQVAILDVAQGRLLEETRASAAFRTLLLGEAAAFVAMWNDI